MNYNNSQYNNRRNSYNKPEEIKPIVAALSINEENFADLAEKVIRDQKGGKITNTQLRSLLNLVHITMENAAKFNEDSINTDILSSLQYLKMKIAYSAGREEKVKQFVLAADIFNFIEEIIKSKKMKKLKLFDKYFEALVAYNRFYGGDE